MRGAVAGSLVALMCAIVGTWVVLRGSVFLGDAMSHGMLPGVAAASALGGNLLAGALTAALAMAYGVSVLSRTARFSSDTSIGLLLVGMLAVGVIVVSHSNSYAVDLTAFLFGDVLGVQLGDIAVLTGALVLIAGVAFVGRRAFVAATFDARKAATLGLRPALAGVVLTVLIAVAIVASFHVVGTLLVLGLLVAPPAAATLWAHSIGRIMLLAAVVGVVSVWLGLLLSWHAATAGGASIAAVAVALFFCSAAASAVSRRAAA
ncbi:zinc ABC transporter permease AztB [Mycolicibacterium goodii]|uniref:zinc ABC transporter permease AztB n=1 Tax=Mycolicibacterium goodii TaxID=134601 RepID=UPI00269B87D9